jgi:hypothetical protein
MTSVYPGPCISRAGAPLWPRNQRLRVRAQKPTPSQPVEPRWNIGGDDPGACFHGRLPYDRNRQRHFCLIARSPQGGVPVRQLFERFCVPTVTFPRMKKPSGVNAYRTAHVTFKVDKVMFLEKLWRRLIEVGGNMQKYIGEEKLTN